MIFRFTLIDRDSNPTVIDDPIGWDKTVVTVKRDASTHGITFDYAGNSFEFTDIAAQIIKDEHDRYGVEGQLILLIEEKCATRYEELYRGRLVFPKYVFTCSDSCSVKIPIETTSDVMDLTNKWDQKVDLYDPKAFDETTDLATYDKLPIEIDLPSKGVFIQDVAINDAPNTADIIAGNIRPSELVTNYYTVVGTVEVAFDKSVAAEIGSADPNPFPVYSEEFAAGFSYSDLGVPLPAVGAPNQFGTTDSPDSLLVPDPDNTIGDFRPYVDYALTSPLLNYAKEFPNYGLVDKVDFAYRSKGRFKALGRHELPVIIFYIIRVSGAGSVDWINTQVVANHQDCFPEVNEGVIRPPGEVIEFDNVFTNPVLPLNNDDRLYLGYALCIRKHRDDLANGENSFTIEFDTETAWSAKTISHAPVTKAKVFLVNETISRIAEAITNNNIRAYSEYFGRVDSAPYATETDGCGGLEAITNGLHIRQQEARNDQPPTLPVSMKDMFEGLEPIHHIGFGIEDDPQRIGFRRLRIENWKYFYQSDILMQCIGVNKIERSEVETEHYSTASFGYDKWEAEEYTGLDEFLTKRSYRTTLSAVKNDLQKVSPLIASGYAWEITRRLGNDNSKDWRYDNNLFITCLMKERLLQTKASFASAGNLIIMPIASGAFFSTIVGHQIRITGSNLNNITTTVTGYATPFGVAEISVSDVLTNEVADNVLIVDLNAAPNDKKYVIELGNVNNPQNIIDPPTVYNYRLTPARNAMRWMDYILQSYRNIDENAKLIFTDGTGNFIAAGEMAGDNCRLEKEVITENQTLTKDNFADENNALPIRRPERVNFTYPMSRKDFVAILKKPYGFIYFQNDCDEGIGWIDELKYTPEEGTATFSLIPAFGPSLPADFRIFMEQYNLVFQ